MKTDTLQFKDLAFQQAFYNPEKPDLDHPFSKIGDEIFVEKYACAHVWHIEEEKWPMDGVMIVVSCEEEGGCDICNECIAESEGEHISMISPNGTSTAFTEE